MNSIQEAQAICRRKLTPIRVTFLAIIAIGGGIVFWNQWHNRNNELSVEDKDNGNYSAAIETFEKLGSYRDSTDKLMMCHFMLGVDCFNNVNTYQRIWSLVMMAISRM